MTLDLDAPWDSLPWVVWDFETTGSDPATCMPVSVAITRIECGVEAGHFTSLVDPGIPIPAEATAIHGITDEMAAGHFVDFLDQELADLASDALPVAYSAAFDRTILHRYVDAPEVPSYDHGQSWICPLTIVRDADRFVRGPGRHKLSAVCSRRGIALGDAHNALADARATGLLLLQLLEAGDVRSCPARKLLAHIERRRAEQDAEFQAWLAKQPPREGVTP